LPQRNLDDSSRRYIPTTLGALWGIFVFGEIRGARNYTMLTASVAVALAGCIAVGLSRN